MEILEVTEVKQKSTSTTKALLEHYGMKQSSEIWHHKNFPFSLCSFNFGSAVMLPFWTLSIKQISSTNTISNLTGSSFDDKSCKMTNTKKKKNTIPQ